MKIASFNVNSIRARLPIVVNWLIENDPDVLFVQETKTQDKDFPCRDFDRIGYKCAFKGQKSYNGVAVFSKSPIEDIKFGFDDEPTDQPRLAKVQIKGMVIVNTYIPQGYLPDSDKFKYKLNWFDRLGRYFAKNFKPTDPVLWVGDFNIAPEPRDIYDPQGLLGHVCYHPEVQTALRKVAQWGFVDVFRKHCDQPGQYTFWDYRMRGSVKRNLGWRLDHIMATKPLAKKSTTCYIDKKPRLLERPSDHTPIVAEFDW
ncbi:MAG: exodeoxyribonuclease III [Planctomycetota bacterium]|jgi:exodeoxyribonuclease-3